MKKYQVQNSIGSGNFSTVFKGVILPQNSPCAIKILKSHHNIAIREAQLLKKIRHPNIISIIDFEQNANESRLILQYMGINTLQLYESHQNGLKEQQVKCILFQVALGLSYVHSFRIIHRDVKPENILIDKKHAIVKLIDFGLAIDQRQSTTDYIATRWYRAPQNLLGTKEYTCAIDVFSLGCVIVQLYLGSPLFPGTNNLDQIQKIFQILGYPTPTSWPNGYKKMQQLGISRKQYNKTNGCGLKQILNRCDPNLTKLVEKMLQINPKNRIGCVDLLRDQYFHDIKSIVPPFIYQRYEEDIFMSKPLSFKGFQPVKSSKINAQMNKKVSKINFHQVSGKIKTNSQFIAQQASLNNSIMQSQLKQFNRGIEINENKPIQSPRLLRQQKSTSVDSYPINLNSNQGNTPNFGHHQFLHPIQNNNIGNMGLQNINSLRKLSIPTSISNLNLNLNLNANSSPTSHLQKITSPLLFFNFKQQSPRNHDSQSIKNLEQYKSIENNNQQIQRQIVLAPSGQNRNEHMHSHMSKKFVPNYNLQIPQKGKIQKIQEPQHNFHLRNQNALFAGSPKYPTIPNVQLVNEPVSTNNSLANRHSLKIMHAGMHPNKSINNSFHNSPQLPRSPISSQLYSSKPFTTNQKQLNISKNLNNSSKGNKNFENYLMSTQNRAKQEMKMGADAMNNSINQIQRVQRQNYVSPNHHAQKIEQMSKRPVEMGLRNQNNEVVNQNKQYFLSPNPRFVGNNSPENYFTMARNRRVHAVNYPVQPFYSPPQRNF